MLRSIRFGALVVLTALSLAGGSLAATDGSRHDACGDTSDLRLVNGNILTMDPDNPEVSSVLIRDGRFAAVGRGSRNAGHCAETINLRGRTVVPGLIDSHAHFLRAGLRPGHDVRALETAFSIPELQAALRDRAAQVPSGEFLTAIGGIVPAQFAEKRAPTLAELDAAAPDHPVYLQSFGVLSVTNSLGKAFFESHGVPVEDDGSVPTAPAFAALVEAQTFADKVRGTRDLMSHANSVGLTTAFDTGGFAFPGVGFFDSSAEVYAPVLDLWRNDDTTVRVRPFFISRDTDASLPAVTARLDNAFMGLGDDMLRVGGLGEQVTDPSPSPVYEEAVRRIRQAGWGHQQHSSTPAENAGHLAAFQAAAAEGPIADLRWSLAHVFDIDETTLDALKELGAGVTVQNQGYLGIDTSGGGDASAPFRRIVDSGIPVGGGTDGTNVSPMNPWLSIYFMVTGQNANGDVVNGDQTITPREALRLYTLGSAWFSQDEDELGSIEPGKRADLAVLTDNPLTVDEDDIRTLRSVLTLVNGQPVFSDGTLTPPRASAGGGDE